MAVSSPSKKILIIDDEASIVELISDILTKYNYEPIAATKWTDALDAIGHKHPDLILLDLKMPTIDGASILEFIRDEGIELPVIIVSGFITDQVSQELSKFGVSGFIRKPFQVAQLTGEIDRVLGQEKSAALPSEAASPPPAPSSQPASASHTASIDALYDRPSKPAPEPEPEPASTKAPSAPTKDDEVLKAFEKLNAAGSPPATDKPDVSPSPSTGNDGEVLRALEKFTSDDGDPPPATDKPEASPPAAAGEPPALPDSPAASPPPPEAAPGAEPADAKPAPHQGRRTDEDRLQEPIFATVPTTTQPPARSESSQGGQEHHYRPRRRSRSSGFTRRNVLLYGTMFIVALVISGFLALMQWYAAEVDFTEIKAKAQESMTNQVKDELLKELQKRK